MASVLLCEDERLGRHVAVKRLHADSPIDVEQRFKREAKLGASLNHPNVVSVFDTATDDEGVLIVMEYVAGHPLSQMLRRGPLRPEEVCRIVRDVGDALDHAHAQGVVHRDVKPGNVLIRDDGVTKLADLGIATAADDTRITRSGIVLGTAAYMAPEQLDGRGAGPASDIYALAAIAFEALSGKKPREGKTPMAIAHSMATEPPPDVREGWPKAPAAVAAVLQRGMALEPEDRPASAGEMARELEDALEDDGRTPQPMRTPTRRFRRRGAAAAGAGAGAAGAGAAAGTPVASGHEPAAAGRARTQPSTPTSAPPAARPPFRAASGRRRPRFAAVAIALVFVALAIAAVVGAVTSGGGEESSSSGADSTPREPAKKKQQKAKDEPKAKEEPKSEEPAAPATPAPAQEEEQAPAEGASGDELNRQGFDLMGQGRYDEAIPILQQAVESFPAGTSDLNYAYALFNLGKSLRMVGRYDEAIDILEQRLKIPNQTETVRRELELAKQQAKGQ